MIKTVTIAFALAAVALSGPAFAKTEKQVTRTIWEISDFPDLQKKADEVCGGKLVKSAKLEAACTLKAYPAVTKAGAFRNTGIGAELNALMRQVN